MVEVNFAINKIRESVNRLEIEEIPIEKSTGYVLAKDYLSPISFPPFSQSAMDGYAVRFDTHLNKFNVIGEIKAGDNANSFQLENGEACRIFTGAMLPQNANCVIKQEDVSKDGNTIIIEKPYQLNDNIRPAGEQILKGEVAVKKDVIINPGVIGFLQTLGFSAVEVFRKPRIAIIATGSELVSAGNPLEAGQIYESNTSTLISALNSFGLSATTHLVEDDYEKTKATIDEQISNNDLVLITGGISVGDYDFVGKALEELQVEKHFYKVKQKPGKPLFFGQKGNTSVFGLPGNPSSVLTSFYVYVLIALEKMVGRTTPFLKTETVMLNSEFSQKPGLTYFLKGLCNNGLANVLPAQSSAMLSSYIDANCLVIIEEEITSLSKGDIVEILKLN